jgi:outer membrane protein, heavy metal efflux system
MRTTIQQSEAEEITQPASQPDTLRRLGIPAARLALQSKSGLLSVPPAKNNTEGDIGLSYLIERGGKRLDRSAGGRKISPRRRVRWWPTTSAAFPFRLPRFSSTPSLPNRRSILPKGPEELPENRGHQRDISFKAGGLSENDYLMIKLQLLQFESRRQQAQLAKVQALSDLRQLLGYESVSADTTWPGDSTISR